MRECRVVIAAAFLAVVMPSLPTAHGLRKTVTLSGITSPVDVADFGMRTGGECLAVPVGTVSGRVYIGLCTASQYAAVLASSTPPTGKAAALLCEQSWEVKTGDDPKPRVVKTPSQYTVLVWRMTLAHASATLNISLTNPGGSQLEVGDEPMPIASVISSVTSCTLLSLWTAVVVWGVLRGRAVTAHVLLLALLVLDALNLVLCSVFWIDYSRTGVLSSAMRAIEGVLDSIVETAIFALILVLSRGWNVVVRVQFRTSDMRASSVILLLLLASMLFHTIYADGYFFLSLLIIYFFCLPRVFASLARNRHILHTYRALFLSLGLDTAAIRAKLSAVKVLRGLCVFYFAATLVSLSMRSVMPWQVTWISFVASVSSRLVTVALIAVAVNPITHAAVTGDFRRIERAAIVQHEQARVAEAHESVELEGLPYRDFGERLNSGEIAVMRLPAVGPGQRPRFAVATRISSPAAPPSGETEHSQDGADP